MHGLLLSQAMRRVETVFGRMRLDEFRNLQTQRVCRALSLGDIRARAPLLARVHSSCVTSEFYGACDCDCAPQLDAALAAIVRAGRGVLFYLDQEGRGAGLTAKARDRMLVQASGQRLTTFEAYERMGLPHDLRRYDEVAAMCALLAVEAPLVLMTNNPDKVSRLEREKLRIAGVRPLAHEASPFNAHYLHAKRRSGHALAASPARGAAPPEGVAAVEARALPSCSSLVRVAAYRLPVTLRRPVARASEGTATPSPCWMALDLYVDLEVGGERVGLSSHPARATARRGCRPDEVLVRLQPERALERLPLRTAPARRAWEQCVVRAAAGAALVAVFSGRHDAPGDTAELAASTRLLAHRLGSRPARLLVDECDEARDVEALEAGLRAHGVRVVGRCALPADHGA